MSTYWGYVCESHDPPLYSDHWVNHGENILIDAFRKERAGEWPDEPIIVGVNDALDPEPVQVQFYADGYGSTAPIYWLRNHPRCQVALHNEYGDRRTIGEIRGGSGMTGMGGIKRQHALHARQIVSEVESDACEGGKNAPGLTFDQSIAIAQVHATLAVADALSSE